MQKDSIFLPSRRFFAPLGANSSMCSLVLFSSVRKQILESNILVMEINTLDAMKVFKGDVNLFINSKNAI